MRGFFINNWATVATIIIVAAYAILIIATKQWDQLRQDAYRLMLKAEMTFTGTQRGQEKMEYVFQKVYSLLPMWIQFFYTPGDIKEKLQEWFNLAKDGLDDGKLNNSI